MCVCVCVCVSVYIYIYILNIGRAQTYNIQTKTYILDVINRD